MICYYGGKQKISSKIIEHIPPHTVYVEPFCGGCAVMFEKGLPKMNKSEEYREVINDINQQLITMFRQLQNNINLEYRLKNTLYSRDEYNEAKQINKNPEKYNEEDIAWAFFVNIHMSFATKLNGGFGIGLYGPNLASKWKKKTDIIKDIRKRLEFCTVENDNAINIIKRYDSPQTFFYCDPPYPNTEQGHYSGYTLKDYKDLLNILNNIQGSFILSCYATGLEPETWKKIDFKTFCTASGSGKIRTGKQKKTGKILDERIESIWIVDRSANVRKELIPILWCPNHGYVNNRSQVFDFGEY